MNEGATAGGTEAAGASDGGLPPKEKLAGAGAGADDGAGGAPNSVAVGAVVGAVVDPTLPRPKAGAGAGTSLVGAPKDGAGKLFTGAEPPNEKGASAGAGAIAGAALAGASHPTADAAGAPNKNWEAAGLSSLAAVDGGPNRTLGASPPAASPETAALVVAPGVCGGRVAGVCSCPD